MANNSLWLYDTESDDKLLIAKGWPDSWDGDYDDRCGAIGKWIKNRDFKAASGNSTKSAILLLTEDELFEIGQLKWSTRTPLTGENTR